MYTSLKFKYIFTHYHKDLHISSYIFSTWRHLNLHISFHSRKNGQKNIIYIYLFAKNRSEESKMYESLWLRLSLRWSRSKLGVLYTPERKRNWCRVLMCRRECVRQLHFAMCGCSRPITCRGEWDTDMINYLNKTVIHVPDKQVGSHATTE